MEESTTTLRARLESDMKAAMKRGDATTRDTLRFLLADVKNAEIDKRRALTPDEADAVLQRQAKRMNESIEQYQAGNRPDLVEKEAAQLSILKSYLPAELSDTELDALVRQAVLESGAASAKEMGKVMPIAMALVGKRADGKRVSAAVKTALSDANAGRD